MTWRRVETVVTDDLRQVIAYRDTSDGPERAYLLGEERVLAWFPEQPGLRVMHELRRPSLGLAAYGALMVLAEGGVLLSYDQPYQCAPEPRL